MAIEIDLALLDRRMLGAGFDDLATWSTWVTVLRACFGLPLVEQERETFAAVAGGRAPPTRRVRELWCVAGRRSGKSRVAAAVSVYLALFVKHRLAKGEKGMCLVLAGSLDQSRTVFNYVRGFLEAAPALRREVVSISRNEIRLRNGIVIAVHSNSFRTVRGRTLVACVMDETAYWRDESTATPDVEVYRAVLPSLTTTNGLLISISTPYRKLGLLHQKHRDYFAVDDDDILVIQASSKQLNPTLSDAAIAAQRAADPAAAPSEWDATFRDDLASYLTDELIDGAIERSRPLELPPASGVRYAAFVDANGGGAGAGADAYTVAVGHRDGERVVVDLVRGVSGGDPHQVTFRFAALCKEYGITQVTGDSYAAAWVSDAWRAAGITYQRSERTRSEIYLEVIPVFSRGLAKLPNHPKLVRELRLLERATHRSGRDAVSHPRG
jgi:hypothetical protein